MDAASTPWRAQFALSPTKCIIYDATMPPAQLILLNIMPTASNTASLPRQSPPPCAKHAWSLDHRSASALPTYQHGHSEQ
eukprot:7881839-Ditylum_brightwellii.AAC.1